MIAVGFTVIAENGEVRFEPHGSSSELATRMMSFARARHSAFLLLGRLYYKADRYASDAALAAALYDQGGIQKLEQLEGDFVLVGVDDATKRLIAVRSPLGAYPLFWSKSGDRIALSTSIRPLLDHLPDTGLNDEYAADYLAYPMISISELPAEHTAYRGVQRLLAGWILQSDLVTGDVKCRRYWDWAAKVERPPVRSVEEAGLAIRERLEAAVRERLSPSRATAAHFSGGMDSTGVALQAEKLLGERGQRLEALAHVYSSDAVLLQEREFIDCALEGRHALAYHPIPSDDFWRWDEHDRCPPLDEPGTGIMFYRQSRVLMGIASAAGADTVFSGDGADHLFAHSATMLAAEHLRDWRVGSALRVVREYAAATSHNSWGMFRDALRFSLGISARPRKQFETMSADEVPPWFRPEYARSMRLWERTRSWGFDFNRGRLFSASDMQRLCGDWFNWNIGAPHGVLIARPYFDARVVSLALGLPARFHEKPRPMKPVLAAAMKGVLPDKIIHRTHKAHFAMLIKGYARHRAELEHLIDGAPIDDAVVDRGVLRDCVEKVALNIFRDAGTLGRLEMTLTYLKWLSDRQAWRAQSVPRLAHVFATQ
jgi:asparagine synthase (glutamine-hydrolysing)